MMALASRVAWLSAQLRDRPGAAAVAAAAAAAILLLPLLPRAVRSYRLWLSLGPGGPPYNVLGWLGQAALQPLARGDTLSLAPFARADMTAQYAPHGRTRFLAPAPAPAPAPEDDDPHPPLPARAGPRPDVPGFVAPQRQTTQRGAPARTAQMHAHLAALAAANPGVLALRPSRLEGGHTAALYLADAGRAPRFLARLHGELAHVHGEGSAHATLSLADAHEAVRQGWAQRHPLSGVAGMPCGYLLLYAPRDDGELDVWRRLVAASVLFACAGGGLAVKV